MGQRSPLVTLAATAAGLVVLLVVNSTMTTTGTPGSPASTAPAATPTASAPPASPSSPALTASPIFTETPETPETPAKPFTAVYTGRTNGREATLAVAVKGGRAVAYVCDGRRVEAWLTGTFTAGRLALRSRSGEQLTGTVAKNAATGTLTLSGRTLRFVIDQAGPPAGLYRARKQTNGAVSAIGWIVLPDGTQVGVDNDGSPGPAPRLDPDSRAAVVDGTPVTAQSITGDETF